jgi:hypothetical protein
MTLKKRYKTKKDDQAKGKPKPGAKTGAKTGAKMGAKPREQQNFIDRDDSGNSGKNLTSQFF